MFLLLWVSGKKFKVLKPFQSFIFVVRNLQYVPVCNISYIINF
jgi:hypothetical protein